MKSKVYAHRGYSGRYPENTMLAFREAEKTGCFGIELDVQLSKDGEVVIIHDETLDRTTTGSGNVVDYTLEELRKFNAAKLWPDKTDFEPIPTFDEYCAWVAGTNMFTNIELKTSVYYYREIEEKTLEIIKKYGLTDRVMFSSFLPSSLTVLRELAPAIDCGALLEHAGIRNPGYYCKKLGFQAYHPGWKGLTKEDVDDCKANGIALNVWTVNDMDTLQKLVDWEIEGIITNYPVVSMAYIDSVQK